MAKQLKAVLDDLKKGNGPSVILVGGDNDYLSEQAFRDLREVIAAGSPGISVETFEPGTELAHILDSYRTMSLFGGKRLLVVPELNAFVTAKEIDSLLEKSLADWKSAKTDRKRATASAKLLHVLGLVGADLEMTDRAIADALGADLDAHLAGMIAFSRVSGKKASRGEGDAALLAEALNRGGAPGTILLLRTGAIPRDSSTVELIDRLGAVVVADLTREGFTRAMEEAIGEIAREADVRFDAPAVTRLRQRLGIERMLADKFSKDVPDLRSALSEAERLVTLAGEGGRVTAEMIDREVQAVEGGARYEFGSLIAEGKVVEAVVKLRELVAQARREEPKTSAEILYGRFLFPLADELRQLAGIHSYARLNKLDLSRPIPYMRFKDTVADKLGDFLKVSGLVRQRPHPFPLHKKWEGARLYSEQAVFRALADVADLEVRRKSGGVALDIGLETLVLGLRS